MDIRTAKEQWRGQDFLAGECPVCGALLEDMDPPMETNCVGFVKINCPGCEAVLEVRWENGENPCETGTLYSFTFSSAQPQEHP